MSRRPLAATGPARRLGRDRFQPPRRGPHHLVLSRRASFVAGNAVESVQAFSTDPAVPLTRYWTWRFDRTNELGDPTMLEDFWAKSVAQALADLESTNDPLLGIIRGPADVMLVEESVLSENDADGGPVAQRVHGPSRKRSQPRLS